MAKERMVAGYVLKQEGVIAPGEPIKCSVKVPVTATILTIEIDGGGNFVLFAEAWSHPEGTAIAFKEHSFLICGANRKLPPGNWQYFKTCVAGMGIYHLSKKKKPRIVK